MNYHLQWRGVTVLIVNASKEEMVMLTKAIQVLPDQPQLSGPITHRICEKCWNQIEVRKGNFTFRDNQYVHVKCPLLHNFDP